MIGKGIRTAAAAAVVLAAGVFYLSTAGGSSGRLEKLPSAGDRSTQTAESGSRPFFDASESAAGRPKEKSGAEKSGEEKAGAEKTGAEKTGAEKTGAEKAGSEKENSSGDAGLTAETETTPIKTMWIHVCGEVVAPGVYELAEGSRVCQAVEAAGGFTEAAQQDYLNMAQELFDGMKVEIPDRETARKMKEQKVSPQLLTPGNAEAVRTGAGSLAGGSSGSGAAQPKVNINTASKEQLMTLRGVGGSRAEDIIAYREARGAFKRIEDIMKVSGIKEAMFEKIKESITVQE